MAYYIGMENANVEAGGNLLKLNAQGSVIEFSFQRLKSPTGATSTLMRSQDLSQWSVVQDGVDGITIETSEYPENSGLETVTIRLPENQGSYLRLEVSGI